MCHFSHKPQISEASNLQLPQLSKKKTHKQLTEEYNEAIILEKVIIMTAGPLARWRKSMCGK